MSESLAHDLIFELSVAIDAPCDDVFDFMADLRAASAAAGAPPPKMTTDPPIGIGTQWMWTPFGRGKTYSEIIAYDRPTVLTRRISGPDMSGVVDESFEPDRSGTKLTRRVNVRGNNWKAASLQSQYLDYLHSIKSYFDRKKQIARENLQLDRDAQDATLIAAERARIKGTVVPPEELSRQIAASMKHRTASASNSEREFFATQRYPHSRVLGSGPGSSSVLRMLCGSVDTYITCLFGHPDVFYKKGVKNFYSEAARRLTGRFKRTEIILPVEGHEELYWEDAVSMLEKPDLDKTCRHVWRKDRFYIVLTNVHPTQFIATCFPLVSIDITDILPSEVGWVVVSIGRLCSRSRLAPLGMPGNFGRHLFAQTLSLLPGADMSPRIESALDILSLPLLITPAMSIDFKYFKDEVRARFESVCEETLSSRPGALSFRTVLADRFKQRREPHGQVATLSGEESIREFWE